MNRRLLALLATIVLILTSFSQKTLADAKKTNSIVGVWEVEIENAPFSPHLFTFHADGTMLSTNPGNVQLDSSAAHGGTNDSLGMGVWKRTPQEPNTIIGTFCELNAHADNHQPTDTLYVTYKIKLIGDTFAGIALAKQGTHTSKAKLIGHTRIKIDRKSLAGL